MKKTALAVLLISALVSLHADDELKNPDFSDGGNEWTGDGEPASVSDAADTSASLSETPTPQETGWVIKLSGRDWTKIYQDFTPTFGKGTLTISYKVSPGTTFSTDRDDYLNVSAGINITAYESFSIGTGDLVAVLINSTRAKAESFDITPQPGSTEQTFTAPVEKLGKRSAQTLYVAFPPGDGKVTLLYAGIKK